MHIFLYGPSGSGKSTVGKSLAHALDLPFYDLDADLENSTGRAISEIILESGEGQFRNLETELLKKTIEESESVVALGGGALLREENREAVNNAGKIIFLDADYSTLQARLHKDDNKRPLLAGDLQQSLADLLENRRAHYASFPVRVDASMQPADIVWEIQRRLGRFHLRAMGDGYDVRVQKSGLDAIGRLLRSLNLNGPILLVSDENVAPLYADRVLASVREAGYSVGLFSIPSGETHKTIETVSDIWHACLKENLERESTIVSLGGGVVSDLAGFAAATFMRGCNWVAIPTTVLAMVDASIGGKTGFDLPEGKNLIGAFHPPRLVLSDPQVISTLPDREFRAGLSEVVKHGVIDAPELFNMCGQGLEAIQNNFFEIICRGIAVKVKIIEQDPYEQGYRAALNYGHTIGHALESISGFSMLHGEAVAVGMVAEAKMAEKLSVAQPGLANKIGDALSRLELSTKISKDIHVEHIFEVMKRDKKKSQGAVRFALPEKIGKVKVGINIADIPSRLEEII